MKFLLIGSSVVDIITKDGKQYVTPGGIYYSASALRAFMQETDHADLLTNLDDKHHDMFEDVYSSFGNELITNVPDLPIVKLTHHADSERGEEYYNITDKLNINLIEDYNEYNGILINMITGFDIGIDDLEHIRQNYTGTIYLDIHTLSRGLEETSNGKLKRNFRSVPEAERWLNCIDILQCNRNELQTIARGDTEKTMADYVLKHGVKYLIVTKGSSGAALCSAEKTIEKKPVKVTENNTVGCGDVFGAVFFYSYISKNNIELSLTKANTAAAVFTGYDSLNRVKNLKYDTIQKLS